MSMEFTDNQNLGGGGSLATGVALGSLFNRDRDDGKTLTASTMMIVLAVIFFVIIFIIAIIALAMFNRDHRKGYGEGTDIAAMLTPLIAAKGLDCNNRYDYDHDEHGEIKNQIAHLEDRRVMADNQKEIQQTKDALMAMGFGLSGQIHTTDKTNLENFAKLENQIGGLNAGMQVLIMKENNRDIINGVIQQLTMGKMCVA